MRSGSWTSSGRSAPGRSLPPTSTPAGSDHMTPRPVWSFRPWVIAMMAIAMGLSLIAVFAVIWFRFSAESRATFDWFQRLTLLAFFGAVLWILYRMATVRVSAYDDELLIRNVFRTYHYPWTNVKGLRFSPGDPWLQLFDAEG